MARVTPPVPKDEQQRLNALRRYRVLDTAAEPIFDSITSLATLICETPTSVLTLVDESRQWFKSRQGLGVPETERQIAFCAYTIAHTTDFFEVVDARLDSRFRDNPLVTASPDIRFYAGVPLVTSEGHAIGSLAVIDKNPKRLDKKQRDFLSQLGKATMQLLDLRRTGWESSAPYQVLFQASPLPMIEVDKDCNVRLWNKAAETLFDWSSDEVKGKFNPIVPDENRAEYLRALEEVIKHNRKLELNTTRRRRDGVTLEVRAFLAPVRSETGVTTSVIAVLQDVTDTRKAQRELEHNLSVLSATLDSTTDGILVVNREGRYIAQNRIFREIWHLPDFVDKCRDQDVLDGAADQLHNPEAFKDKVTQLYNNPELESFDVLEFKDGRTVERYSRPQRVGSDIVGRVWSFRDVTTRVSLEQHVRQSQKLEAIGALAGGVAHDFNNLLNVIIGYTSLIAANLSPEDKNLEYANNVRAAADSAANLTRQLLAFSRQQVLHPKPIDLNETVAKLAQMLPRVLPEHIDFRLQLSEGPLPIKADPGQMEQVMMNLVVNARDAMPTGGSLTLRTSQSDSSGSGGAARIEVSDTGHGIDTSLLDRIFDPFFTTKDVGKGTGLGLSTVYGIVRQSGGDIRVQSEVGKGTTFTITLPLTPETVVSSNTSSTSSGIAKKDESILVVEDNAALRTLAVHLLQKAGYRALEAPTGQTALEIIHREKVNLLLSDVVMPGMSGMQLAQEACKLQPGLPIILMSGYSEDTVEKPCDSVRFLQKPFSPETLLQTVRQSLDLRIESAA